MMVVRKLVLYTWQTGTHCH